MPNKNTLLSTPPRPEHERLIDALAGSWTATEREGPPLSPIARSRNGYSHNRPAMGGLYLINDYAQHDADGHLTFEGHGVYGYDPAAGHYTMQWFDSQAFGGGAIVPGQWLDNTLRFEVPGRARYEYEVRGRDEYVFRLWVQAGAEWLLGMEGAYVRV